LPHRRTETGLRPVDDVARNERLTRLLQYPLAVGPVLFHVSRKPVREAHDIFVEEWHANLHAGRHAHLVRIEQVVIGEEEPLFERQHPVERRQMTRQ
jgi:hypothetical protein